MADVISAIAASVLLHAAFFGFMHMIAVVVVLHAFDMEKVVGYDLIIDVAATIGFTMFYSGTYTGSTVGIFAGLFMSGYLRWYKRQHGYKKLEWDRGFHWFYYHNNPAYKGQLDRVRSS
jgi:hypothetical protein